MSLKGKIYGLVGVIGSGKSYRAEEFISDAACAKRPLIMGDFSEGIRETLMNILTGESKKIDCNSEAYAMWKRFHSGICLPFLEEGVPYKTLFTEKVSGRELLTRTGEYLKKVFGPHIWARWTENFVFDCWNKMSDEDADACDIVFGSLRFDCEAEAIFRVAEWAGKEVKIYFCDYHSDAYELSDHVSEKFAQYFLSLGCKDGDDITKLVKQKLDGKA